MVLLWYAIIPCLAAYTVLVSLIFAPAIPTSFNILIYFTRIITLSDSSTSATADYSAPTPTSPPSPNPTIPYGPVAPTKLFPQQSPSP